jgi:hypothetical protein
VAHRATLDKRGMRKADKEKVFFFEKKNQKNYVEPIGA